MIVTEYLNNGTLVKHYSDAGLVVRQVETGAKFGEAIDVVPCPYTYEEAEPDEEENQEITDTEALGIILGEEGVTE